MKNKGRLGIALKSSGYTITEVLVFLGVSAAIFFMMAGVFSQQQRNSQFTTAAREMESRISDIANDISSGYYNNPGSFSCSVSGGVPQFTDGIGTEQGRNSECIFLGRVIHLDTQNEREFLVYNVAGARTYNDAGTVRDVRNYNEARPQVINVPASMIEKHNVPPGLVIKKIYLGNTPANNIHAIGFFASLNDTGSATAIRTDAVAFTNPPPATDDSRVVDEIQSVGSYNTGPKFNPAQGVTVCLEGDGTSQRALIRIGGQGSRLATDLEIGDGTC